MNRLFLNKLVFTGSNKKPAMIDFTPGLNVITGPSNTGKTLVFQCLNYVLGSSKKPKSPPEAKGYTTLYLTIHAKDQFFTIERSIQSTDVRIFPAEYDRISKVEPLLLSANANATDNLSDFLLRVIGIENKRLKKNDRNETVSLTFNILKNILLVDELKIQSENSPIFSAVTTNETPEKALFRFLLTGVDYSSIIAIQKSDVRKANANARIDLLTQLIKNSKNELLIDSTLEALQDQLDKLEASISSEVSSMNQSEDEITQLTDQRKTYWESYIQADSKIDQLKELHSRFDLLSAFYRNDLKRLDAIIATGDALTEIKVENCPTCGAKPEHHQPDCVISNAQVSSVLEACVIERNKVQSLMHDLSETLLQLSQDIEANISKKTESQSEFQKLDIEISSKLNPVIAQSKEKIAALYGLRQNIELSIKARIQIDNLQDLLSKAEKDLKIKPTREKAETGLLVNESSSFVNVVYDTLKSWGYPELDTVYFSEIDQDFVIGEKSRVDQGKGYRALSHAAFIVALMDYCLSINSNHPGFVVLDSPLVTFRGADPDVTEEDGIPVDAKDSFFVALSGMPSDRQVVIIDNDEPPENIKDKINYIHFTKGKKVGRAGFIPEAN